MIACVALSGRAALGQVRPPTSNAAQGVLIDFQDTDLRLVITALAEAGGINVTFGELPSRRVTLRMRQPVARADILPLLRSLAQSNGLLVRDMAGVLRIEQAGDPGDVAADSSGPTTSEPRLFVHRLRHAQAARLASTLQSIFGGGQRSDAGSIRRRPLSDQLRESRIPATVGADTSRAAPASGSLPGQLKGEVQIVPDEATNALLVRALPEDWLVLRQAVDSMDLRPLQVLIEVLIAEVRTSEGIDVGVTGKLRDASSGNVTQAEIKTSSPAEFVLSLSRGGRISSDVALGALATRGDVRVLSRPLLIAQNNVEAKILVGSQRPFVQVSRSLPTDLAVRDQIVQYRDVGTSLTILPTINPDDYVNLQVVQEVSTATDETQFGAPVISTREASTRLFVKNGNTAVLGGLVDRQRDQTKSGIPLLSSIPVIGALFRSTRNRTSVSELFLFLTPHLVRSDLEMEQLRQRIERDAERLEDARQLDPRRRPVVPDTTRNDPRQ